MKLENTLKSPSTILVLVFQIFYANSALAAANAIIDVPTHEQSLYSECVAGKFTIKTEQGGWTLVVKKPGDKVASPINCTAKEAQAFKFGNAGLLTPNGEFRFVKHGNPNYLWVLNLKTE